MGKDSIQSLIEKADSSKKDSSVTSSRVVFAGEDEVTQAFERYCRNLLQIEAWEASSSPSSYEHFDEIGRMMSSKSLKAGSFIRISIAGSGKPDWVRVVSISSDENEMVFTVSPTFDPTERPQRPDVVSHFFASTATNNFCLQRAGQYVTMWVIGLNEHQNTDQTSGTVEAVRNMAVANLGSYLGVQKSVWKEFCTRFLQHVDGAQTEE